MLLLVVAATGAGAILLSLLTFASANTDLFSHQYSLLMGANIVVAATLIILVATFGNALLNAMLAPLLGLNLSFRQSLLAILMSFTIVAAILGAFSPLVLFLIWNTPPLVQRVDMSFSSHSMILLTEVSAIAFAGVAANLRLVQLLHRISGSLAVARKILFAWLAGNLLLGSQLAWVFRPFIGSPGLPVEFIREDALRGSFFEAVFRAARHFLS